ncbi:nitrogen regulation protein NIFR3 [Staphylococcus aureus]|nr:nitrogen regulation protein NIFR3 [Staphylococcus aureus]
MLYWRAPNAKADEKSAYNNVQVGVGPQHREFRKEILQAMQVGGAPNKEADEKSAYNNVQVGEGQK